MSRRAYRGSHKNEDHKTGKDAFECLGSSYSHQRLGWVSFNWEKTKFKKKSGIMKIERGGKQLDKKKIMVNKQEANSPIGSSGRNVPFSDDRAGRRLSGGLCRDPFAGSSYGNERKTAQLSSGDGTQVCLFFPPF